MKLRLGIIIGIIAAAALFRLLPHPPNVTPVAAMALFAGAHLSDRRLAFTIPFAALFLSDLLLGFHATMPFVYAGFALTVMLGLWLGRRLQAPTVLGGALAGSVLFFLLTNFGSWLVSDLYPRSLEGLMAAYAAGLPFFRNSLLGDLFFTALFFGGLHLADRRIPRLRQA